MRVGIAVKCVVCKLDKAPHGRSVSPLSPFDYCDYTCPGYNQEPLPGCLWPGETTEDFGYQSCISATREA